MTTYKIYYTKPEHFREFILGEKLPTRATLSDTHVHLMNIAAEDLEDVFYQCQGEAWSPHGEARHLIRSKGLDHTSMSVGDVIECDGKFWAVSNAFYGEPTGFTEI